MGTKTTLVAIVRTPERLWRLEADAIFAGDQLAEVGRWDVSSDWGEVSDGETRDGIPDWFRDWELADADADEFWDAVWFVPGYGDAGHLVAVYDDRVRTSHGRCVATIA